MLACEEGISHCGKCCNGALGPLSEVSKRLLAAKDSKQGAWHREKIESDRECRKSFDNDISGFRFDCLDRLINTMSYC